MALGAVAFASTGSSEADDTRGRWHFGGSLGYHATLDASANNADLAGDPRPDDFVVRETTVEDTLSFELAAGFGPTSRLSLQAGVGYFRGEVGPVDAFLQDRFPSSTDPLNQNNLNDTRSRQTSLPVTAAILTQVPVMLSATYRFRKDKPLNPFLGAGAGMLYTDLAHRGDVERLNRRLSALRITGIFNERNREVTPRRFLSLRNEGRIPMVFPVDVEVKDAFAWHLAAGLESFLGDRLSLVGEARYVYTSAALEIQLRDRDQLRFTIFSERLFRPDGSLKIFNASGQPPNPLVDPNQPTGARVRCSPATVGDFDGDGRTGDLCYNDNPGSQLDDPRGSFLVQGGRVNLSGLRVMFGLRFHF